jgi:hypothetical protein
MKRRLARRQFLQAATLTPLASLAMAKGAVAGDVPEPRIMPRAAERSAGRIRIGTIQSNEVPSCRGLRTNPFSDDFSIQDLFASIERRMAWFEQLLERAASEKCQLAVITEDFTRLGYCMTFLDDRSIFRRGVERQTSLIPQRLAALARKCSMHIVACYFAMEGDDVYNVADLFGSNGSLVGRYRKVHLPQ